MRPLRPALSPCPAARCWPTWSRSCCSLPRPSPSTADEAGATVSSPLLIFWAQLFSRREPVSRVPSRPHIESSSQASSTIFLVMRRMRAPLITLIVIFFISVIGLTLIPGVGPDGQPARLSLFDSFYFMSYTATTIGFGELPWPFTAGQRLWVTFSIYLSVVGWAYAIGSLLTLV